MMFLGIFLIGIGVLILLERMGIIHGSAWGYIWPVALIALGASAIFSDKKKKA
jgi:hypothetical protein